MKRCAIDLDGVLNYYPIPWLNFLKLKGYHYNSVDEAREDLGIFYDDFKTMYRTSPMKRNMTPRRGAVKFLRELKEDGYIITITTKRPVRKFPHLEKWTIDWLDKKGMVYDNLMFIRNEDPEFCWAKIVIDDDPFIIEEYKSKGINAHLFNGSFDLLLEEIFC